MKTFDAVNDQEKFEEVVEASADALHGQDLEEYKTLLFEFFEKDEFEEDDLGARAFTMFLIELFKRTDSEDEYASVIDKEAIPEFNPEDSDAIELQLEVSDIAAHDDDGATRYRVSVNRGIVSVVAKDGDDLVGAQQETKKL